MPNEAIPRHPYARVAIGAAIAVIIAALAYIAWQSGRDDVDVTEQPPAPLSDEDKLQVMQQLSASVATSVTSAEQQKTLDQLRTVDESAAKSQPSEQAKMQVLQSLHTN